ncbi:hypothetical protein BGZ46_000114, partial [Entomortierella lignicola]
EIVSQIVNARVSEPGQNDIDLLVRFSLLAVTRSYIDFKAFFKRVIIGSSCLVSDIVGLWISSSSFWQIPSGAVCNEDTYIKRVVIPFIDGTFDSMNFNQHWQRDRLLVPNGYYEVLEPDFFGEQDMLTFVIMEVKKPNGRMNTVESDARKLPCMLKIALNLLLHANVDNPTVIGLLIHGKL